MGKRGCGYNISKKIAKCTFNSRTKLDPVYKLYQSEDEFFYFPLLEFPASGKPKDFADRALSIDPWPAFASERINTDTQIFKDGNKLLSQTKEQSKLKPPPKPRFLVALENKIIRDSKKLGISEDTSDPLRLQLYGEIFDHFIEECAYYAPLLAKIKDQYEGFINHLRQKIKEMLPIKELLWVSSFNADKRVADFQNRENRGTLSVKDDRAYSLEINLLKVERNHDKAKLDKMKQECIELRVTVSKLKEQLEDSEEACSFAADSRKLLISEMNDLSSRLRELEVLVRAEKDRNVDDPVKLKILVGDYEKALEEANLELNKYRSDFEERVPRVEYDEAMKLLEAKTHEVESLKDELDSATSRYSLLRDHCENLTTWRDFYNAQILYIARVLTAKSEPSQKVEYINAMLFKYRKIAREKTAEQLADFVASDLAKAEAGGLPSVSRPNPGRNRSNTEVY